MKKGITYQSGALYWKSFCIAHVNIQVEPHVQRMVLQGRHMCVYTQRQGDRTVFWWLHAFIHTRKSMTDMKQLTDPL